MLVYSRTIVSFITKLKAHAHDIMSQEMGLRVLRSRFEWQGYLYPLHIVCFEEDDTLATQKLGYFSPDNYQLGINRNLMFQLDDEFLKDVLRHELAHCYCYLKYGREVDDHGVEYRAVCREFGWSDKVWSATTHFRDGQRENNSNKKVEVVLAKVQKLLALASSGNSHESELATIKANELLIKYNLSSIGLDGGEDEQEYCVATVLTAKRNNAKLHALYDILQNFFVQPVFSRSRGRCALEVVGTRLNVELADYIAKFLDHEFEVLWKKAQKEKGLKGSASKNSFFKGVAKGFCEKLNSNQSNNVSGKDLVRLNQSLQTAIQMAYSRLSGTASGSSRHCGKSESIGRENGRGLSIRPGLKQGGSVKQLGFRG